MLGQQPSSYEYMTREELEFIQNKIRERISAGFATVRDMMNLQEITFWLSAMNKFEEFEAMSNDDKKAFKDRILNGLKEKYHGTSTDSDEGWLV